MATSTPGSDAAANVVSVLPAGLPQRGVLPESAAPALDTFVSPPDLRVVPPIEGMPADAPPAPVGPRALVASNALDAEWTDSEDDVDSPIFKELARRG